MLQSPFPTSSSLLELLLGAPAQWNGQKGRASEWTMRWWQSKWHRPCWLAPGVMQELGLMMGNQGSSWCTGMGRIYSFFPSVSLCLLLFIVDILWVKMEVVTFLINILLKKIFKNDAVATLLISWWTFQKNIKFVALHIFLLDRSNLSAILNLPFLYLPLNLSGRT